ncbi:cation diffusion facilitator family transporter [Ruegeria pomeroyi]|uniref:Cation efflux system protein n=2 Tax=Ruegeria pomeroyi TaxID=89184 RepID=Q5LTM6_RUEPO|nr:cation diffusion facilitator family transporter [Ruegeria pomeroyi]HCE69839.1 cation transporter [Ruegeria sp.]AAV94675.1 cation efflux system protein [Ruegeria pomeroyi DSS-3]NVK95805.1 cation transporter [Ruegeria pomeroyi]NVL04096.1 cation transporter [Ruegeria pomeroyi]QWV08258.1 cation diffusion facilitator family transporter [Ruegeria pomeroyi]
MPHDHGAAPAHSHAHGHHHHHHHHHIDPAAGDARITWAIAVNMVLTLAQVVGGLLSGSLALIADALHNFSDAVALIIAFGARRIARRPADARMSYGYGRAEVIAALINYTTLIVLALYLVYEGIMRFLDPQPIDGWLVVWIAALALVIDLVTAALTWSMAKTSMNIRAAFLHNLADALGSVAVIVAGSAVIWFGWTWVDPLVTLMIAAYILWHVWVEIGAAIGVLMLGTPPGYEPETVAREIEAVEGVQSLHLLHLWSLQENAAALSAHLVIEPGAWGQADAIKARVKTLLEDKHGIAHVTLETECAAHACHDAQRIGSA